MSQATLRNLSAYRPRYGVALPAIAGSQHAFGYGGAAGIQSQVPLSSLPGISPQDIQERMRPPAERPSPPRPANDNVRGRPVDRPANDNSPAKNRQRMQQSIGGWKGNVLLRFAARGFLRRLLSLIAVLAMIARDLGWKWGQADDLTGWTLICGGGTGGVKTWSGPGCALWNGVGFPPYVESDAVFAASQIRAPGQDAITYKNVYEQFSGGPNTWYDVPARYQKIGLPFPSLEPRRFYPPLEEPFAQPWPQVRPRGVPKPDASPSLEPPPIPEWFDPWETPIMRPLPEQRPIPYRFIPYRQPNPFRAPGERRREGPAPRPRAVPEPATRLPNRLGDQRLPTVSIDGDGNVKIGPKPHFAEPPSSGVRESKWHVSGKGGRTFEKWFGGSTEAVEFVEEIWKAIPTKYRSKEKIYFVRGPDGKRTPIRIKKQPLTQKLKEIYENFDKIDWDKAYDGLVEAQIKDRFFGRIGQAASRASRKAGYSKGLQKGVAL